MHYVQGATTLAQGVAEVEVTYPEPLTGNARVWSQISTLSEPLEGLLLYPFVVASTATGFKAVFNGMTDSEDYVLFWHAGDPMEAGGIANTWIHGSGPPSDVEDGDENDYYLDADTGDVYHKVSGSWVQIGNFKGEAGSVWHADSGVPSDALGNDGDFYLNVDNQDYYEKSGGTWTQVGTLGTGSQPPGGPATFTNILRRVGSLKYRRDPVGDKDLFLMVDTRNKWSTEAVDFKRLTAEMVRKRAQVPGNTITPSAKYLEMALDPTTGILYVNDGSKWGRIQLNFDWWP